jgi:nicotinamidase-related amidase
MERISEVAMRVARERTAGLVIDIQERLFPTMADKEEFLRNARILIRGLAALAIPIVVCRQYPKGLGDTIPEIGEVLPPEARRFDKTTFSCADDPETRGYLDKLGKRFIVLTGIETHVCVLQTAVDLLEAGYVPVVAADCVTSRSLRNRDLALARLEREGAVVSCAETVLFELLRRAEQPEFKEISRIVK